MVVMWSRIFLWSFSGMPYFLHDSGASSIRRPVTFDRGAVVSFLRYYHCECHPLLDIDSRIDRYSPTQLFKS